MVGQILVRDCQCYLVQEFLTDSFVLDLILTGAVMDSLKQLESQWL